MRSFWPNWNINTEGRLEYDGCRGPERSLSILHMDDDLDNIFDLEVRVITPFFPQAHIIPREDGDHAFQFLLEYLEGKRALDLFITDIYHPGMGGILLVKLFRRLEAAAGRKERLPIMIYSNLSSCYAETRFNHKRPLPVEFYYLKTALRAEQTPACSDFVRKLEDLFCS